MKPAAKTHARSSALPWPVPGFAPVAVAFFVLFFLYVWLRIEPAWEYQHSAPTFRLGHSFFRPFLSYPGGPVDYGAAFLAQLNYYNALGALVYTLIAGLIFLATRTLLSRIRGVASSMAPFGPPFVLLLLRDRYDSPSLAIGLGLLLAVGLATGYDQLPEKSTWLRLVVCWVISALLFYVAGLGPCWLFGVLAGLLHVAQPRRWPLGLGCVVSVLVGPLGLVCLTDADAAKALKPWGHGMPGLLCSVVYLVFSVAAVVLALWPRSQEPLDGPPGFGVRQSSGALAQGSASRKRQRTAALQDATAPQPGPSRLMARERVRNRKAAFHEAEFTACPWHQTERARRAFALGLMLLGWVAVWFVLDGRSKAVAQVDYYAGRREYHKVLAAAARLNTLDPASEVRLHRALYHAGRLGQDLFSFTNQTGWNLIPALSSGLESCRPQSETFFELGQVNLAEHFAHEALEWEGERPDLLRLLARINLLKDRPKAARIFVNVLAQVPFERAWARKCLRDLEANPRLSEDQELAQVRSRKVSADLPHSTPPTETILRQLLQANRRNQMAFEYLMAHYLLVGQVDQIVAEIGRLKDFGYVEIPRHYEEALLLYQQANANATIDLQGRSIRPATLRRFQEFTAAIKRRALDSPEGRQALARDFGDTFWYHFVVGHKAREETPDQPTQQ